MPGHSDDIPTGCVGGWVEPRLLAWRLRSCAAQPGVEPHGNAQPQIAKRVRFMRNLPMHGSVRKTEAISTRMDIPLVCGEIEQCITFSELAAPIGKSLGANGKSMVVTEWDTCEST